MTYHFRDTDGHEIETQAETDLDGQPVVTIWARGEYATVPVRIPVDRIEELVAGLRDTARQTASPRLTVGEEWTRTYTEEQPA